MIYAMGRRGATEGGRGWTQSDAVQSGEYMVRIMDAGDYSPKIWLRLDLRGQNLKVPVEPDLHRSW